MHLIETRRHIWKIYWFCESKAHMCHMCNHFIEFSDRTISCLYLRHQIYICTVYTAVLRILIRMRSKPDLFGRIRIWIMSVYFLYSFFSLTRNLLFPMPFSCYHVMSSLVSRAWSCRWVAVRCRCGMVRGGAHNRASTAAHSSILVRKKKQFSFF
jgi:hypothetical protein